MSINHVDNFGRKIIGHEKINAGVVKQLKDSFVIDPILRVKTSTGAFASGSIRWINKDSCIVNATQRFE